MKNGSAESSVSYPVLDEARLLGHEYELAMKGRSMNAIWSIYDKLVDSNSSSVKIVKMLVNFFPGFNRNKACKSLIDRARLIAMNPMMGQTFSFSDFYRIAKGDLAFSREDPALFKGSLHAALNTVDVFNLNQLKKLNEIHKLGKDLMNGPFKSDWKNMGAIIKDYIHTVEMLDGRPR